MLAKKNIIRPLQDNTFYLIPILSSKFNFRNIEHILKIKFFIFFELEQKVAFFKGFIIALIVFLVYQMFYVESSYSQNLDEEQFNYELSQSLKLDESHFAKKFFLFDFYKKHISVADGNRCVMYPSCSRYTSLAVEKHGVILGFIMAFDRLVRCNRDEAKLSDKIILNDEHYIYDPIENNDFWWTKK